MRYLQKLLYKPQQTGCVLHLINKSPSATLFDNSGQGNNGTITGATWVRLPSGLWVNYFDGSNDIIKCADTPSLEVTTAFTISAWVKKDNAVNSPIMVKDLNIGSGREWGFWFNVTNNIYFEASNDGTNMVTAFASSTSLNTTSYHLLTITYDGTNVRMYADGVLDSAPTGLAGGVVNTTEQLWMGYRGGVLGQFYGSLFRLYNRARSATEEANVFQRERHLFNA